MDALLLHPAGLVLLAVALSAVSGVPALFLPRKSVSAQWIATGLLVLGALLGLGSAAGALYSPGLVPLALPWALPFGDFTIAVDGLSALFLLPVFLLPALGSIYGLSYYSAAAHPDGAARLRLFYGLLTAAMALLLCAHSTVVFLLGWEGMALSAFFLVTTEDGQQQVREAGWVYLVATHVGTLCLFALFGLLHSLTGTFAFSRLPAGTPETLTTAVFVLSLLGFGLKAGLMPLHVWLPGAHSSAPSHVSAALSGVMIKMGVYGLVRTLSLFPQPPPFFGEVLLGLGAISAVLGMAFALGQQDLKRMLAYCSIENVGIITIGLGLGTLGRSLGRPEWVVLGLGGALLHVLNHALFKSLLFLSAGSVIHAVHTREIDRMGGLLRDMPCTALCFLLGAAAICGLPPLNGFVSELLIYLGLFRAATFGGGTSFIGGVLAAPALALTGALSAACFVKVFGTVFLGSPRLPRTAPAHESPRAMLVPMVVLLLLCVAIGLLPLLLAPVLQQAIGPFAREVRGPELSRLAPLGWLSITGVVLLGAVAGLALLLRRLARRPVAAVPTWDCGYAAPAPSMQYTSSSFAQMLVELFGWALRPRLPAVVLPGQRLLFPREARFHSQVPDTVLDRAILPSFRFTASVFQRLRFLQQGNVHIYLFYIFATLVVLLWR